MFLCCVCVCDVCVLLIFHQISYVSSLVVVDVGAWKTMKLHKRLISSDLLILAPKLCKTKLEKHIFLQKNMRLTLDDLFLIRFDLLGSFRSW